MNTAPDAGIHRYLDSAFEGVPLTPDAQDLKEELRASLTARVAELTAAGADEHQAAAAAIAELGDLSEAIGELGGPTTAASDQRTPSGFETLARYRVKPKPRFVATAVILSLLLATTIVLLVLGGVGIVSIPTGVAVLLVVIGGVSVGSLVFDSTRQETTTNHPLPAGRAAAYAVAALVAGLGLGSLGLGIRSVLRGVEGQIWLLPTGVALTLVAIVAFIWLGLTQTNRRKAWALEFQREQAAADRFAQDPAAAARFGIYTVVIWILAIAAFIGISVVAGFAWSWLALVAGFVVFFLVLARMLFPAEGREHH